MLKNYFTIALRNFRHHKFFSLLHVLGLSIGISAALVIFLVAHHEFSFDKFEAGSDRIYRVVLDVRFSGNPGYSGAVPAPLGGAIEREVKGVELTVPVFQFQGDATTNVAVETDPGSKPIEYTHQADVVFTNPSYFQLLPFEWISGSPQGSLQDPFSVVLTESRARQYFPGLAMEDIPGHEITYGDSIKTTVTGIVRDLSQNTSFQADEFISLSTISKTSLQQQFMMGTWDDWMAYSQLYIKLAPGVTASQTEKQLAALISKYNPNTNKDPNNTMLLRLQPLSDVHFNNHYQGVGQRIADKPTLYGLFLLAFILLLLACINFINLTTAQASQRAKEIGIRKTMGGSKAQLVYQFLTETFFITGVSACLSVALVPLLLKAFAGFIPSGLVFNLEQQPEIGIFLVLLILSVTLLSGLYPAFILSARKPVSVLKNQSSESAGQTRGASIRKILTVSQFTAAQFLIIATLIVGRQIHFSLHTDLGFQTAGIISFEVPNRRYDTPENRNMHLLNTITSFPEVDLASRGFLPPANEGAAMTNLEYKDGRKDIKTQANFRWGDTNYLRLYRIPILAGRNVRPSDTIREFLINETLARMLGFRHPSDALNKEFEFNGQKLPIVGVMKDFHSQSMHIPIGPLVFAGRTGTIFHIRLKPDPTGGAAWHRAIAKIQLAYSQLYPGQDFNYNFFEDTIAGFYQSEQHLSYLLTWATGLAIFLSCLGLLGLVIFTIHQRTKEIGIRKVLGASWASIVSLLSEDFMKLVLLAFVLAIPVAWWAAHRWLEGFAYQTRISWWIFGISGVAIGGIALITLGILTLRAALANPVKSLSTE